MEAQRSREKLLYQEQACHNKRYSYRDALRQSVAEQNIGRAIVQVIDRPAGMIVYPGFKLVDADRIGDDGFAGGTRQGIHRLGEVDDRPVLR